MGNALPLEDAFLELLGRSAGAIEIVGGPGSGKTTALAHLAAVIPANYKAVFLDEPPLASVIEAADTATVVFTSSLPLSVPGAVSYRLASWGRDDLMEYLLTMHPRQCGSVIARLETAPDGDLPEGHPELWRIVLDRMAADGSVASVSAALRAALRELLPTAKLRTEAEKHCLAVLTGRINEAAKSRRRLDRLQVDARAARLLGYGDHSTHAGQRSSGRCPGD